MQTDRGVIKQVDTQKRTDRGDMQTQRQAEIETDRNV